MYFLFLLIGTEHVRIFFSQQKRNIGNTFLSSPSLRLPYNLLIKRVSHFFGEMREIHIFLPKELQMFIAKQLSNFFQRSMDWFGKAMTHGFPVKMFSKNPILKDCLGYPSGYPKVSSSRTPTCSHLVVWNMALKNSISFFWHNRGMSSFPLTNSIIFQDGYCTTNQPYITIEFPSNSPWYLFLESTIGLR